MIKTVLIDFDGVIGTVQKFVGEGGSRVFLAVSSRDSYALRQLAELYRVIIVSASKSELIKHYANRHGVRCALGVMQKGEIFSKLKVEPATCAAIGDDLPDVEMLRQAAVAWVPADAHPALCNEFNMLATAGGHGVIAEILYKNLLNDTDNRASFSITDNGVEFH